MRATLTIDQVKACHAHAKKIGLKIDPFKASERSALAFLMRDKERYCFCFYFYTYNQYVGVQYFVNHKTYHTKLTVEQFLKTEKKLLDILKMMAQTANEEADQYTKMLKSLPKRHKGEVETVFKLAATNG